MNAPKKPLSDLAVLGLVACAFAGYALIILFAERIFPSCPIF